MSLYRLSGRVMPLDRGIAITYTVAVPLRSSATPLTICWYFSARLPT